jgi:hypothetical protein
MDADVFVEHGDLVPQGRNFKGCIASALEEDADNREHRQNEFWHEFNLVTRCNGSLGIAIASGHSRLIPLSRDVLSTHSGWLKRDATGFPDVYALISVAISSSGLSRLLPHGAACQAR